MPFDLQSHSWSMAGVGPSLGDAVKGTLEAGLPPVGEGEVGVSGHRELGLGSWKLRSGETLSAVWEQTTGEAWMPELEGPRSKPQRCGSSCVALGKSCGLSEFRCAVQHRCKDLPGGLMGK